MGACRLRFLPIVVADRSAADRTPGHPACFRTSPGQARRGFVRHRSLCRRPGTNPFPKCQIQKDLRHQNVSFSRTKGGRGVGSSASGAVLARVDSPRRAGTSAACGGAVAGTNPLRNFQNVRELWRMAVPNWGTFSADADKRGQFQRWTWGQALRRKAKDLWGLPPASEPALPRKLSALSTGPRPHGEKVPKLGENGVSVLAGSLLGPVVGRRSPVFETPATPETAPGGRRQGLRWREAHKAGRDSNRLGIWTICVKIAKTDPGAGRGGGCSGPRWASSPVVSRIAATGSAVRLDEVMSGIAGRKRLADFGLGC
jgi:hypothetical protein